MSKRDVFWSVGVLVAAWAWLAPAESLADGFHLTTLDQMVSTTQQRAVIWSREQGLAIHLQTSYDGAQDDFGWIIPFPEVPIVGESTPELFDQLDLLTAPSFLHYCYCCCPSTGYCPAGGEGVTDTGVTVWDEGTVGNLDYRIISAAEGEELEAWLSEEGFVLPDGARELLDDYAAEGQVLFTARVSPGALESASISPIVLTLPAGTPPFYPMRLTQLSTIDALPLTLWVVADEPYVPENYPWSEIDGYPTDVDEYREQAQLVYAEEDGRTFLVEHAQRISDYIPHHLEGELYQSILDPWLDIMMTERLFVTRLSAQLPPEGMTEDIFFETNEGLRVDPLYQSSETGAQCCDYCPTGEDCTDGVDNNDNGLVDCEETEVCGLHEACGEDCTDGVDNNDNGLVDCEDTEFCMYDEACAEPEEEEEISEEGIFAARSGGCGVTSMVAPGLEPWWTLLLL